MDLKVLSSDRKKVNLLRRRVSQLERILMERSPMVAASFMPRRLKPKGPVLYYLSASIQGESWHRHVRKGEVFHWRKRALAWRRVMRAVASWVKVSFDAMLMGMYVPPKTPPDRFAKWVPHLLA